MRVLEWGLAVALLAGCQTLSPGDFYDMPGHLAHGGFVDFCLRGQDGWSRHGGELIAVDAKTLYVVESPSPTDLQGCDGRVAWQAPPSSGTGLSNVHAFPMDAVYAGDLQDRGAKSGALWWTVTWTAVGALATISNGVWLIFTLPGWVAAGGISIGSAAQPSMRSVHIPGAGLSELASYARFPQGMPVQLAPPSGLPPAPPAPWVPAPEPGAMPTQPAPPPPGPPSAAPPTPPPATPPPPPPATPPPPPPAPPAGWTAPPDRSDT